MNKTQTVWANETHYEKAHAYLEDQKLDSSNQYYYVQLLESKGVTVNKADLRNWLKSLNGNLNTKGFEL